MKFRIIQLLLVFSSVFSYSVIHAQSLHTYIVVIGVDGLSAWALKKYPHPVMDSLMSHGTYTLSAKAVRPTLSAPNWASILTGYKPDVHHIKSNHWKTGTNVHLELPTVFHRIAITNPAITQATFYQWKEFDQLIEKDSMINKYHCANEQMTMEKAANNLITKNTQFTFIHLDNVDSSGHNFGQKSKQYKYAVDRVDSLVGNMIHTINQSELKGKVYIVITSDHGFWGKHHGGITRKEKNIPWILVGPGIKEAHKVRSRISTIYTSSVLYYLVTGVEEKNSNTKLMQELFSSK